VPIATENVALFETGRALEPADVCREKSCTAICSADDQGDTAGAAVMERAWTVT
jgi:hypothetical protein